MWMRRHPVDKRRPLVTVFAMPAAKIRRGTNRATQLSGRERILNAAEALFGLHGFHAVTMRALGEAASCRMGLIYHHFGNKEALLDAVLKRRIDDLEAPRMAGIAKAHTLEAMVAADVRPLFAGLDVENGPDDPHWPTYLRLLTRMAFSAEWRDHPAGGVLDQSALMMTARLQEFLPELDRTKAAIAVCYARCSALYVLSDALSLRERLTPSMAAAAIAHGRDLLVPFIAHGVRRVASTRLAPQPAFPIPEIPPDPERSARDRILDAAEHLLARNEIAAITLRQITKHANVNDSLLSYHLGAKEDLIRAVQERRGAVLHAEFLTVLGECRAAVAAGGNAAEATARGFVEPCMRLIATTGQSGLDYWRIIVRLAMTSPWDALIAQQFDHLAWELMQLTLPDRGADPYRAHSWAVSIVRGALSISMIDNGRVDLLSDGAAKSSDIALMNVVLTPYLIGGLEALAAAQRDALRKSA